MIWRVLLEGLGLGGLLILACAVGIRNGAVGMVHLYEPAFPTPRAVWSRPCTMGRR